MADIKQAAKWMNEGKRVRRPRWILTTMGLRKDGIDHAERLWLLSTLVPSDPPTEYVPYITDLLADDWEIAE